MATRLGEVWRVGWTVSRQCSLAVLLCPCCWTASSGTRPPALPARPSPLGATPRPRLALLWPSATAAQAAGRPCRSKPAPSPPLRAAGATLSNHARPASSFAASLSSCSQSARLQTPAGSSGALTRRPCSVLRFLGKRATERRVRPRTPESLVTAPLARAPPPRAATSAVILAPSCATLVRSTWHSPPRLSLPCASLAVERPCAVRPARRAQPAWQSCSTTARRARRRSSRPSTLDTPDIAPRHPLSPRRRPSPSRPRLCSHSRTRARLPATPTRPLIKHAARPPPPPPPQRSSTAEVERAPAPAEQLERDPAQRRVAIGAAGTAGLGVLIALLDLPEEARRGWTIELLERREDVGGIWYVPPRSPSRAAQPADSSTLHRVPDDRLHDDGSLPATPSYPALHTNPPVPTSALFLLLPPSTSLPAH